MIESIENLKRLSKRDLQRSYNRLFTSSEDGRLVLEDLKMQCFYYHFTNGPRDEGKTDILKYIQEKINPLDESVYDEPTEEPQQ